MNTNQDFIKKYCSAERLESFDPYSIWITPVGNVIKKTYYKHKILTLPIVSILTIADDLLPQFMKFFYVKQESPIVYGLTVQILLNEFKITQNQEYLMLAKKYLKRLDTLSIKNTNSISWGIGFPNAIDKNLYYDKNTPYSTMTPYVLEAFGEINKIIPDSKIENILRKGTNFVLYDLKVMYEDSNMLCMSYTNKKDRIVVNASSYTMYMYAYLQNWCQDNQKKIMTERLYKILNFIQNSQNSDGSWYYAQDKNSFIDCFHSCIVLKNIIKTLKIIVPHKKLPDFVYAGFDFLMTNMLDKDRGLFRRFAITNKPGIIKYDLYDNAEMLNLMCLLGKFEQAEQLEDRIFKNFINKNNTIYSRIDLFNRKINPNSLRWAIIPFLYALSIKRLIMR